MNNMPTPPKRVPVKDDTNTGLLTDDEQHSILEATLKPKSRTDSTTLAFISSFIRNKNIAQASAEAGINPSEGYKIRHRTDVSNCIQKIIEKSAIKYGFDASELVERTKEIVDFDPIMLQNPDGTYKSNLHDIAPEARRSLKKLKVKNIWGEDMNGMKIITGEMIEYEFYDKLKAVELVGKEKDLFKTTTRVEHDVTKDMASVLLAASKRGAEASAQVTYNKPDIIVVDNTEVVDDEADS